MSKYSKILHDYSREHVCLSYVHVGHAPPFAWDKMFISIRSLCPRSY